MSSFAESFEDDAVDAERFNPSELDRMVDGELSDEQQQSLLKRLEGSSSGWRKLALAYVEAATFRTHFTATSSLPAPVVATDHVTPFEVPETHSQAVPDRKATTSTVAAIAVLAVFGLGVWLGRTQIEPSGQPLHITEENHSPQSGVLEDSTPDESGTLIAGVPNHSEQESLPVPETVQVVFNDGQSDVLRVLDIPIADSDFSDASRQLDEFWNRDESAIPAELRAALEQSGHEISEFRDFWPAQLPDGRAVVIPVSQFHVASNPLLSP